MDAQQERLRSHPSERFGGESHVFDLSGDAFRSRLRVTIRGAVQGVGFRPFVYRLATTLGLAGWVHNSPQGFPEESGVMLFCP
jgi:hypothetical protein